MQEGIIEKEMNGILFILHYCRKRIQEMVDASACDDFYRDATGGLERRHRGSCVVLRQTNVWYFTFFFCTFFELRLESYQSLREIRNSTVGMEQKLRRDFCYSTQPGHFYMPSDYMQPPSYCPRRR
jgi:hypothetical protein